jgi:hypothetical protein
MISISEAAMPSLEALEAWNRSRQMQDDPALIPLFKCAILPPGKIGADDSEYPTSVQKVENNDVRKPPRAAARLTS